MHFIIDEQLPPQLAVSLRRRGAQADHVRDLGLASAPDSVVFNACLVRRAILVTRDAGFAALAQSHPQGRVVFIVGHTAAVLRSADEAAHRIHSLSLRLHRRHRSVTWNSDSTVDP